MRESWKLLQLKEVVKIVNGGTPKTSEPSYWDGNIPWLTPKDMGRQKTIYATSTIRTVSQNGLDNSSAKLVPPNSVILSTRAPIGHLTLNEVAMAFNQGCRGLVPSEKIVQKFLYYFLLCNKNLLNELGTGTTFKELSAKNLSSVLVPIPPLSQQVRIVEVLDTIFAKIDRLEEIEKIKSGFRKSTDSSDNPLLDQLRQSILQKAFAGELIDIDEEFSPQLATASYTNDNQIRHAAAIAYADSYFRSNAARTFHGRIAYEKAIHLIEAHADIDMGRQAIQGKYGPTDDLRRYEVEKVAAQAEYFSFQEKRFKNGNTGYELKRGAEFNSLKLKFERQHQAKLPIIDDILSVLSSMDSETSEVLATVYTAWNNFLLSKQTPSDKQIVHSARDGWHEAKMNIAESNFFTAIKTLRDRNLEPKGQGKYVGKIAGQSFDF